jgi:glutathione S-transferase
MLRVLQIPYEYTVKSFVDGGTKSPNFLDKNPNGQVPLLELEDGQRLAESNAILLYLAELQQKEQKTTTSGGDGDIPFLLPRGDAYQRGLTYQWLFFEQYSHEPAVAVRRANIVFERPCPEDRMQQLLEKGHSALTVMEKQLSQTPFLVGNEMTIADMALFAYTHVAHEGEYDMKLYPNIEGWLQRVR